MGFIIISLKARICDVMQNRVNSALTSGQPLFWGVQSQQTAKNRLLIGQKKQDIQKRSVK